VLNPFKLPFELLLLLLLLFSYQPFMANQEVNVGQGIDGKQESNELTIQTLELNLIEF